MLNGLLEAGDCSTHAVIAGLDFVEGLVGLHVPLPLLFDLGLHGAQFRHLGLQGRLPRGDFLLPLRQLLVEGLPAQRQELGLDLALLLLHHLVALGRLGLALQLLKPLHKF